MCLLLVKPAGVKLTRAQLQDFNFYNPDGFGMMYATGNRVNVVKTLRGPRKQWKILRRHDVTAREVVLHWRQATSGLVDLANCHPFPVGDGICLAHNGVLHGIKPAPGKNDTREFIDLKLREFVQTAGRLLFKDADVQNGLGNAIGTFNKFVFLAPDGQRTIINESTGRWYEGCWYSNDYAWSSPFGYAGYTARAWDYDSWKDTIEPRLAESCRTPAQVNIVPGTSQGLPALRYDAAPSEQVHDPVLRGAVQDLEDALLEYTIRFPGQAVHLTRFWSPDWLTVDVAESHTTPGYSPDTIDAFLRGKWREVYDWAMAGTGTA